MENTDQSNWEVADTHVFWGEVAPTDHVVQIYEDDETFFNLLEGFVRTGLDNDEAVIIIATPAHLAGLKKKLIASGLDIDRLSVTSRLLLIDTQETLSKFMVEEWPDAKLFQHTVSSIINLATLKRRNLRVFGELVAVLSAAGQYSAALHLENLWNRFCKTEAFCLFCAYPKSGFAQDLNSSLHSICCAHTKMISGEHRSKTTVFYKTITEQAN